MREIAQGVSVLIPKEHWDLILEVNIARNNLHKTRQLVKSIINVPHEVAQTSDLMVDDYNILEVHKRLRKLQRVRHKVLEEARPFPKERRELETSCLSSIAQLSAKFDNKMKEIISNHFTLATGMTNNGVYSESEKKPHVLIRALQVINRENMLKLRKRTLLAQQGGGGGLGGFSSGSTGEISRKEYDREDEADESPTDDIKETEIGDYVQISREWLKESCVKRFDRFFSESRDPKGRYDVPKTLEIAETKLFDDLTVVVDVIRPCFPPFFDVFNIYCSVYHESLCKVMESWSESGVSPDNLLKLARWISSFYEKQMVRLGADEKFLKPPLTVTINPLLDAYGASIRELMIEWVLRVVDQDKQESILELGAEKRYSTPAPTHLFQIVHTRIDTAIKSTSSIIITCTGKECVSVLHTYIKHYKTRLEKEGSTWSDKFLMACINNFHKCVEKTEEFKEKLLDVENKLKMKEPDLSLDLNSMNFESVELGFQDVVKTSRNVLASNLLNNNFAEELAQLLSKQWLANADIPKTIVHTLIDIFKDDIGERVVSNYNRKLANEIIDKLISKYIDAMLAKKQSFTKEIAARLEEDTLEYLRFLEELKVPQKQARRNVEILFQLKRLIYLDNPTQLAEVVGEILQTHPDFTEEMAIYIIENRDDLGRKEKSQTVDEFKKVFQLWREDNHNDLILKEEGFFKNIKLPAGFFDGFSIGKKD
eukprot:TRINITY_DN2155_c0_g1_i1.p1 TRINITY_DN2155_c0_g1~~TRINITY_DN2155_c0_g1_i1.p1  ORF type:complete len:834 (+),score=193.74 TRINITY_DN2155_c0_g1_i1:370-2502(+)